MEHVTEHPRVCGENVRKPPPTIRLTGTSPRMRGKQRGAYGCFRCTRNIPAYAGKTVCVNSVTITFPEHPRVCGENSAFTAWFCPRNGTSPRMRGKPRPVMWCVSQARNIPAYAGKTDGLRISYRPASEHPRVCGENEVSKAYMLFMQGTSPRMRGKRFLVPSATVGARNIPAYAGKTRAAQSVPQGG